MPAIFPAALLVATLFGAQATLPAPRAGDLTIEGRIESLLEAVGKTRPTFRRAIPLWELHKIEDLAGTRTRLRIREKVKKLVRNRSTPMPLRRMATDMLARMLRSAGEAKMADDTFAELGFIRDWWIVGPFDNQTGRGYQFEFLPEKKIDLDRRLAGKGQQLLFRKAPRAPVDGVVKLHALMRPETRAVAYALSVIHTGRRRKVLIEAGCDDACKVWINGTLVIDDPGIHRQAADQNIVSLTLPAGDNRLLVKIVQNEGAWSFSLAASDLAGRAIPALKPISKEDALRAALARPVAGGPLKISRLSNLADMFNERARRLSQDPLALAEAADALSVTCTGDSRQQEARSLLLQAQSLLSAAGRHSCGLDIFLAQTTDDSDLAARLLGQAASQAACRGEALSLLGRHYQIRNRLDRALDAHTQALRASPGYLPAKIGQIEIFDRLQLEGLAEREILRLLRTHPGVPEVLQLAGTFFRMRQRIGRSREIYRRLVALKADDLLALRALYELAVERGDLEAAKKWMDSAIELSPERTDRLLERGDLLLHNGRPAEALENYRRASEICPRASDALIRQGMALMVLGRETETLKTWKRALALSPQDRKLRRRIEFIQKSSQAFYLPYRRDVRDFLESKKWCLQAPCDGAGAVRLMDLTVVRLHPNGLASHYRQQLIGILNPGGADAEHTFGIEYAPGRQQVRILGNRVLHADGSIDESSLIDDFSVSEPWYNLYYDVHTRQVTFPVLSPGDLIELIYVVDDVDSQDLMDGYFGDLTPFQFNEPAAEVRYVLLSPDGFPIFANRPAASQQENGKQIIRTWEQQKQKAVEPEADMPGFLQTHSYLHVSSYRSWHELAENYLVLVRDQLVAGPELRRLALSQTAGLSTNLDKIRALYRLVADRLRYVGLEFGIHSYVPYPVSQVLARNYGDCKDKASLLAALLQQVGIRADLALVRTSPNTQLGDSPASFAVFDHAICHLPDQGLWLDATVPYSDIVDLPPRDQNAPALIIAPDTRGLVVTPSSGLARNKTRIDFEITPAAGKSAHIESVVSVTGSLAPTMRAAFIGASSVTSAFEKSMNDLFPGAQVRKVSVDNLLRPDLALITRAVFEVPNLGRSVGGGLEIPALGRHTIYQKIFAAYQSRMHDLMLGPPWSVEWQVVWLMPKGWLVTELPKGGRVESPYGAAHISLERSSEGLVVSAGLRIERSLIKAADYKSYREFLGRADRLLGLRLVLQSPGDGGKQP
jgi:cellulose synthase operon protein C